MSSSLEIENGKKYVNRESVPVEFIVTNGRDLKRVGAFLLRCKVPSGDALAKNDDGQLFLCMANPYRDADEEHPERGDHYVIFPNKKVILYTSSEFDANFKMI